MMMWRITSNYKTMYCCPGPLEKVRLDQLVGRLTITLLNRRPITLHSFLTNNSQLCKNKVCQCGGEGAEEVGLRAEEGGAGEGRKAGGGVFLGLMVGVPQFQFRDFCQSCEEAI